MSWILLFSAILLEIFAASQLQLSEGFTQVGHSVSTVALFTLSSLCIVVACKKLDAMLTRWYI